MEMQMTSNESIFNAGVFLSMLINVKYLPANTTVSAYQFGDVPPATLALRTES